MKYIVTLNGKNYEVEVEKQEAKVISVTDAAAPSATVPAVPTAAPAAPSAPATGEGFPCPMPGSVLEIKKRVGDAVKKGETILTIEAMKMENDIPSPSDGVVKAIYVEKGAAVSTGAPLFLVG